MKEKFKIISEVLGDSYRVGGERLYFCPYCKHHKKKLSVNVEKNAFKCWICDQHGRDLRRLVRRFGNYNQVKEWDKLTNRVDLNRFENIFAEPIEEPEIAQKVDLPEDFISLTSSHLPMSAVKPMNYLRARGVTKADILKWKIGYCDAGPYANRIIVPSFGDDGYANYFIARAYDDSWPRYKNPPVSRNIVFNELYVDWEQDLVLVEGVFDAIVAGNAIPLLGSTLRQGSSLFKKIIEHDTPIFLALDSDASHKQNKITKLLMRYGIEVYCIDTSGYEDVGEMSKDVFEDRKKKAVFVDSGDYLLINAIGQIAY